MFLELPNVTLIAMASKDVEATVRALEYSSRNIQFGEIKLVSHYKPDNFPAVFSYAHTEETKDMDEWSFKAIYELPKHVNTEFAMLIHADGFIVNPDQWRPEFLEYDYIGAPWALPQDDFSYRDTAGNLVRVGNSVSIRSKRLMDLPNQLNLPWEPFHGFFNEDGFICCKNRQIYLEHGMKYAPIDVAKYFSHEIMIPEIAGIKPFAFHKWYGTNKDYPNFY